MVNGITMGDFLNKAEVLLNKMESQSELHEKQLEMYKNTIDNSMALHRERMASFEKRQDEQDKKWTQLRNTVWSIVFVVVVSVVYSGARVEANQSNIQKNTEALDEVFTKDEVLRGMGQLIENTYESFQEVGMSKEQAKTESNTTKSEIQKEMVPEYRTRSAQPVEK